MVKSVSKPAQEAVRTAGVRTRTTGRLAPSKRRNSPGSPKRSPKRSPSRSRSRSRSPSPKRSPVTGRFTKQKRSGGDYWGPGPYYRGRYWRRPYYGPAFGIGLTLGGAAKSVPEPADRSGGAKQGRSKATGRFVKQKRIASRSRSRSRSPKRSTVTGRFTKGKRTGGDYYDPYYGGPYYRPGIGLGVGLSLGGKGDTKPRTGGASKPLTGPGSGRGVKPGTVRGPYNKAPKVDAKSSRTGGGAHSPRSHRRSPSPRGHRLPKALKEWNYHVKQVYNSHKTWSYSKAMHEASKTWTGTRAGGCGSEMTMNVKALKRKPTLRSSPSMKSRVAVMAGKTRQKGGDGRMWRISYRSNGSPFWARD